MKPNIVFTGGGTAGHVTPNLALIDALQKKGWQIAYVGSYDGVEKAMITVRNIPYYAVSSGKLRRYFSWRNFLDPFKILVGLVQAYLLLRRLKPGVVFSKGGFVAFPVVVGAWLNRIPIVAHESDMSPGLANRLSYPFVNTICVNFSEAKRHFQQQGKVVVTGTPIRDILFHGDASRGIAVCKFQSEKPCLLIIGGSQGAHALNHCIRQALEQLTKTFQVIHLCGRGKIDAHLLNHPDYYQSEYAEDELADFFAASSVVVSRAGANAVCELLALAKPHVLIPLSHQVSRGDQVENAEYFEKQGISVVLQEEAMTPDSLLAAIDTAVSHRAESIANMQQLSIASATDKIMEILQELSPN